LCERGWSVEALTALPNYPTGRIYPGYKPLETRTEQLSRIRVLRVPLYPSKTGFAKRMVTYLSFAGSASWFGPRLCEKPDLLFVESPPLFIGFAALALSALWRVPYVFNVSDLWPESAIRMGMVKAGALTQLTEILEHQMYRRARGVTGQSEEIIAAVRRHSPSTPTAVITNGVDPRRFGPELADDGARELLGREPGPIYIYAGLLGLAQGLDQILDLAKSLPKHAPGRFVLVGDGPQRELLLARVAQENLTRVRILPAQPRERIPALLGASDVALISLGMSIPGAVPSKIYEAMASRLPILLIADGEPARRLERAQAGIAVDPGDSAGLAKAYQRLTDAPELRAELGENGRRAAETEYNRDRIADQLDEFLRGCLNGRPSHVH
jgi:glycosyltransferase involved in cell wall biosynthesis